MPHGLARVVLWLAGVFRHFVLFLLRFKDTLDAIEAYVVWRWRLCRMSSSNRRWPTLVRKRGLLALAGDALEVHPLTAHAVGWAVPRAVRMAGLRAYDRATVASFDAMFQAR